MSDQKRLLTAEEAIELLNEGDQIHTFVNPGGILMGADCARAEVIELLQQNSGHTEIGGTMCRGMGHAIIVWRGDSPLFIENNKAKLDAFDPQ